MSQFGENFIEKDKYIVDFLTNMNLKDDNCKCKKEYKYKNNNKYKNKSICKKLM